MKTRDLRKKLANAIDLIMDGSISPSDGRNIVGSANQINLTIQNELKLMRMQIDTGKKINKIGDLDLF